MPSVLPHGLGTSPLKCWCSKTCLTQCFSSSQRIKRKQLAKFLWVFFFLLFFLPIFIKGRNSLSFKSIITCPQKNMNIVFRGIFYHLAKSTVNVNAKRSTDYIHVVVISTKLCLSQPKKSPEDLNEAKYLFQNLWIAFFRNTERLRKRHHLIAKGVMVFSFNSDTFSHFCRMLQQHAGCTQGTAGLGTVPVSSHPIFGIWD